MNDGLTTRPEAEKRKIHSKNEFELCYLRHQYLRKATNNPSASEMKPYLPIAAHMAKNTFYTYNNLFGMIGFDKEDLYSIAQIHLVSFLGLFSLESMPEKYRAFQDTFQRLNDDLPTEEHRLNKNKANFTLFMKQRMEDVVRVCRQKARNIKGLPTEEYFAYYGPNMPTFELRELIENYERLGFRKLDTATYKSIRKRAKPEHETVFHFNNNWYVRVAVDQKSLSLVDFSGADLDPYDSLHNMDPEQIYFNNEESDRWSTRQAQFDSKPAHRRVNIIRKFIKNNKGNPKFREEVRAARKILKDMDSV